MKYHFVLGAPDPEMEAIEKLLEERGVSFEHAMTADERWGRRRVRPGAESYDALLPSHIPFGARTVMVECWSQALESMRAPVDFVDHHVEGDPGYDAPPKEFWRGSSLGQVCELLDAPPTKELLIIAAADHCLGAAYRGECPGVDPEDLLHWRVRSRARFQRRALSEVMAEVEDARELIRETERETFAGHPIVNLYGLGIIPELVDAAMIENMCVFCDAPPANGFDRVGLQNAAPEQVEEFLEQAGGCGFVLGANVFDDEGPKRLRPYGSPQRGFAGAYVER